MQQNWSLGKVISTTGICFLSVRMQYTSSTSFLLYQSFKISTAPMLSLYPKSRCYWSTGRSSMRIRMMTMSPVMCLQRHSTTARSSASSILRRPLKCVPMLTTHVATKSLLVWRWDHGPCVSIELLFTSYTVKSPRCKHFATQALSTIRGMSLLGC